MAQKLSVDPDMTLQEFIEMLAERPEAQLKKPSLTTEGKTLYAQFNKRGTEMNLGLRMRDLVADREEIAVADSAFPSTDFKFEIVFFGKEGQN